MTDFARSASWGVLVAALTALSPAHSQTVLSAPRRPARTFRPPVSTSDIGERRRAVDTLRIAEVRLGTTRVQAPVRLARPDVSTWVTLHVAPAATAIPLTGPSAPAPAPGWAHVTYISGSTIYLDAGSKAGLRAGMHLDVLRGASFVAELVVEYISSSRASCSVARSAASIAVGDSAHFMPARDNVVAAGDSTTATRAARAPRAAIATHRSLRGRIGVRYLSIDPGLGAESRITQPAFDVRLDGHQLGGSPIGLTVDVRAYRERRSTSAADGARRHTPADVTRIYQTALSWSNPGSPARVTVGRQFSTALSTIGLFDGVAIDMDGRHVGYGGVAGSQPEPLRFGLSGQVREYGLWVQLHNPHGSSPAWNTTLGALGSYDRGSIDREFVFLQSMLTSPRWSFYATQEVDVNRGWKADVERQAATPTATFIMGRVAVNDVLSLNAGYDSRRSVRLYRDFVNPEIEFDESFRRGAWGGAAVSAAGRVRLSVDARTSSGGSAGSTSSWTGMGGVYRLTRLALGAHVRTTQYRGEVAQGQLTAASLEASPLGALHLTATGGLRADRNPLAGDTPRHVTWQEATADLGIGRSIYFMLSAYEERGAGARSRQVYGALSYRF